VLVDVARVPAAERGGGRAAGVGSKAGRGGIVVVLILCVSTVAACSSSGSPIIRSRSGDTAVSADQLVSQALGAMASARSFHIWGTIPYGRSTADVNLHLGSASGYGTVRYDGRVIRVRTVAGRTYVGGNDAYLMHGIPAARRAALLRVIHGKWLHMPPNASDLDALTSIKSFQTGLPKSLSSKSFEDGGPKMVRGIAAASVFDKNEGAFLYVPQSGTPYPLEMSAGTDVLDFDSWNKPVIVQPPPASQVVKLSDLRGK